MVCIKGFITATLPNQKACLLMGSSKTQTELFHSPKIPLVMTQVSFYPIWSKRSLTQLFFGVYRLPIILNFVPSDFQLGRSEWCWRELDACAHSSAQTAGLVKVSWMNAFHQKPKQSQAELDGSCEFTAFPTVLAKQNLISFSWVQIQAETIISILFVCLSPWRKKGQI